MITLKSRQPPQTTGNFDASSPSTSKYLSSSAWQALSDSSLRTAAGTVRVLAPLTRDLGELDPAVPISASMAVFGQWCALPSSFIGIDRGPPLCFGAPPPAVLHIDARSRRPERIRPLARVWRWLVGPAIASLFQQAPFLELIALCRESRPHPAWFSSMSDARWWCREWHHSPNISARAVGSNQYRYGRR